MKGTDVVEGVMGTDVGELIEDANEATGGKAGDIDLGVMDDTLTSPSNLVHLAKRKLGIEEPLLQVTLLVAALDGTVIRRFLLDAPHNEVADKDDEREDVLWLAGDPKGCSIDADFNGLHTRGENLYVELMCDVEENKDGGVNSPGLMPLVLDGDGDFSGVK